jgi:hypothetical protein
MHAGSGCFGAFVLPAPCRKVVILAEKSKEEMDGLVRG